MSLLRRPRVFRLMALCSAHRLHPHQTGIVCNNRVDLARRQLVIHRIIASPAAMSGIPPLLGLETGTEPILESDGTVDRRTFGNVIQEGAGRPYAMSMPASSWCSRSR